MPDSSYSAQRSFAEFAKNAQAKAGVSLLTDEDLLLLACEAMARTYTRDEKDYA
jgi:hypothetical protein